MTEEAADSRYQLEQYRPYLSLVVRLGLDPRLQGKVDLSGVIQQTLLEAHQGLKHFRGNGEEGVLVWLKRILTRNLLDEVRKLRRVKAYAALDRSLDELSAVAESRLVAEQSSPSQKMMRQEELLRVAAVLSRLPLDQQTAVIRRHLQGVALSALAMEMGRSKPAVAGLLHRGLTRMRDLLQNSVDEK